MKTRLLACAGIATLAFLAEGLWVYAFLPHSADASRNSSGTMSAINGPYTAGSVISSSVINARLADVETELTDSKSRSGKGDFSAPARGADGTVAAPTWSYTSETGSGLYRIGSSDHGFSMAGTKVGEWTANGYRTANGAVATPSLSFFNDTGAGLYRAASNDLRFAVNGADKTYWGTLGFGIGAAPATLLHVQGTIVAGKGQVYIKGISDHGYLSLDSDTAAKESGILFNNSGTLKWEVYTPASSTDLRFYDGTADRITIANGGAATFNTSLKVGSGGTATSQLNFGSCTLNGASPSVCTATVASGAKCVAIDVATTAATRCLATSVTTTTLTVTSCNGNTNVVNYVCF